MNEEKKLLEKIIEGIQEKKGKNIVIADLSDIEDTICNYFVICNGNSPSQVLAITESIKDYVRNEISIKPFAIDGHSCPCTPQRCCCFHPLRPDKSHIFLFYFKYS